MCCYDDDDDDGDDDGMAGVLQQYDHHPCPVLVGLFCFAMV